MFISRNFIPSLFTILNAFCGLMSIINAANGDFTSASLFIIYAMLFDAFDGVVARLLNSSSSFGVELDSLSDVISFGVAPSFLLYSIHLKDYEGFGIFISSLIMAFAAFRLARFNVQLVGFNKNTFSGVPAPLASATLVTYILFYHDKIFSPEISNIFIFSLAIALPLLMVSKFQYDTFPKFTLYAIKKNPAKYIILFIAGVLIIITKGEAAFSVCLFIISTGIVRSTMNQFKKRSQKLAREKIEESLKIKEGKK